jgi:hypothetical protein
MRWRKYLKALGLGVLLAFTAGASQAEGFTMHGRVSYDAGSNLVKGSDDKEWSHATINTLLLPGDTLWVDEGGTSEVEFSGGNFLRGADGTKVELYSLPPTALFRVWNGSMYVQRLPRSGGDVTLESPAAKVYVEPESVVRVDIVDGGATTVSVRSGRVTVRAADGNGAVTVAAGQRVWADPGMLPSEPTPFDMSREDALDSWNRERMADLVDGARTTPKEVVIQEEVIGASDLNRYGEWVYVDNRPFWRPTVVVNYTPYRHGYWNYVPTIGNCWVDNYPFSYVTSHYGRWNYTSHYGWVWGYDPVWSPAWVASVRCGDYYVWSPIGYDYRPISYGGARFEIGGVDFFIGAASYVPVSYFGHGSRYVYGCYPEFTNYVRHTTVINIWNINVRSNDRIPVPYTRDLPVDRDYTPRRSIRGLDAVGDGSNRVLASERVQRLERNIGRSTFASDKAPAARGGRTVNAPEGRTADVRQVRVKEAREGGSTRAAGRAHETLTPRVGRAADTTTGRPADDAERPRVAERGKRGETEAPTLTNEDARSARPIPGERRRTIDGPSTPEPGSRDSETTPARGDSGGRARTPIDGSVEEGRSGAPAPSVRQGGSARTRTVESDSEGGKTGSSVRSTPRRTVVPEGDGARTPSVNIRGRSSAGPSVDDVPTRRRTSAPPQESPSVEPSTRSRGERSAPRGYESPVYNAPDRGSNTVRGNAPEPRVERSAPRSVPEPRIERSAPRSVPEPRIERSAPEPRVERSAPRSVPEPRVERSAPRMEQRSAPVQREYNAPTIQRSAPSTRSEPRMVAPRTEPSGAGRAPAGDSVRSGGRSRGDVGGNGR